MPEIKTKEYNYNASVTKWQANIWINREFFHAVGATEEEAIHRLKQHLINIIPIYENNIEIAKTMIEGIKGVVNS